jgi:hypothetical protein
LRSCVRTALKADLRDAWVGLHIGGAVVGGIGDGGFSLAARRLRALPNITPGDFAAVARRHRFAAFKDAAGFVQAVEEECALKKDGL